MGHVGPLDPQIGFHQSFKVASGGFSWKFFKQTIFPIDQSSFNFYLILGSIWPNMGLALPPRGCTTHQGGILDSCLVVTVFIVNSSLCCLGLLFFIDCKSKFFGKQDFTIRNGLLPNKVGQSTLYQYPHLIVTMIVLNSKSKLVECDRKDEI